MKICIVGTGYVGLVTGTCLADVGHDVTCVDLDEKKIKLLKDAVSPIFEPGLEPLIALNIEHERLHFTTNLEQALKDAKVAFIAVGTPEGEDGSADLSHVRAVAKSIGEKMTGDLVVVVKSTVPVGTCDEVDSILQQTLRARKSTFNASVASNPEFLKEGTAVGDFMRPDRIVVGIKNPADEATFREVYGSFVIDDPSKLFMVDRRSSELIKYASNSMLAVRISFMNELSRLCERVGADIDHVRRGMGSDPRIGRKFLWAGPGYGGSCFPKDVAALLKTGEKYGVNLQILQSTCDANEKQKLFAADKIKNHFSNDLSGKTVAVWGLSFKPGTDDVREAPAITIIKELIECGARVNAHDPQGSKNFEREFGSTDKVRYVQEAYQAVEGSDALVLVTEWSEYKKPNWEKISRSMRTKNIFDLRNQYQYEQVKKLGFHYECIGRNDDAKKRN